MGTTVEKLQKALDNKAGIKRALDARRFKDVGENQSTWEDEIYAIEPPLDTLTINEGGTYDVKDYKNVVADIIAQGDKPLIDLIEGDITNLTIPYGTTKLGSYSLAYQYSLTEVTIPESVTIIDQYAFSECTKLKEIVIPDSVTYIGAYCFNKCNLLEKVILSKNITALSDYLFSNCGTLTEITIPNSVTEIGSSAFSNVAVTEITIPESVTTIKQYAFSNSKLKEITIPKTVTKLGQGAISNCTQLEKVNLQANVTTLQGTFQNCPKLKEVILPESVTTLESYVFNNCYELTELTLPESVISLWANSVNIGTSTNKATIIVKNKTPFGINANAFNTSKLNKIFVPKGTRESYINHTNWAALANYIVENNNVIVNIPSSLLNNGNYTYSIDNGVTYNQFTNITLALNDVNLIKIKSTDASQTILIGTTEGGNDVGTIANSELTFSFSGDTNVYLTIQ